MLQMLTFWASLSFLFGLPRLSACFADHEGFFQSADYNAGAFGEYVTQEYKSSDVRSPILNVMKPFTECQNGDSEYIFIAPRGFKAHPDPYILDAAGALVWTPDQEYGQVYNHQVVQYKGQSYLAFWGGNDAVGGHGVGKVFLFDQHYELWRTVVGGNGLGLDLHSFDITPESTFTFTAYDVIQKDVSGVQGRRGNRFIWDSLFQEVDPETNEVLFQWRASDHMRLQDSYNPINVASAKDPWDWFHINSVEKDKEGNYLVSSRYMRAVIYVSGKTGGVLWQLGGRANSFQDLSGGAATKTIGQHDAHWANDKKYHGAITFFDNRSDWTYHTEHDSKGTRVEVDLKNMTARLEQQYVNPVPILSVSQGSYQTLPNGNVLMGYGINPVITEFSPDGTVLCDAYFGPSKDFTSANVQNYRALKFNWTGIPHTKPSIVIEDGTLYMSWLGSTEVRRWLIQDALTPEDTAFEVLSLRKTGFETRLGLSANIRIRRYVQVVAMDDNGRALAVSDRIDIGDRATVFEGEEFWGEEYDDEEEAETEQQTQVEDDLEDIQLLVGLGFLAMLSGILVCWLSFGTRIFRPLGMSRREHISGKHSWTEPSSVAQQPWIWQRWWARLTGKKASWYAVPQDEASEVMLQESRHPRFIVGE
jgi:hypothetical protein